MLLFSNDIVCYIDLARECAVNSRFIAEWGKRRKVMVDNSDKPPRTLVIFRHNREDFLLISGHTVEYIDGLITRNGIMSV